MRGERSPNVRSERGVLIFSKFLRNPYRGIAEPLGFAKHTYSIATLEVPDRLILIIHSYINNREFTFRHENPYSSKRPIRARVPQGSTLSPLLYSAYTNDIPRPQTCIKLVLYADNTTLYLCSCSIEYIIPRLQRAIDELTQWYQLWSIEINPEKSAAIYFNHNMKKENSSRPDKHHHSPHVKCPHPMATQLQISNYHIELTSPLQRSYPTS
ncbi:RNA-directed DNA polymerase from mobile element jockey [Eumeta japonica]|uniref:RNA-directed DNA polymerase from mobile element jockey n=1 Tax=Eumeta variegata TaxID=151549 RepID=A0A4C1UMB4_EUMVA|nr:RNA-directed DNA polymerase from mobile element jockey [Eumeta japonica]